MPAAGTNDTIDTPIHFTPADSFQIDGFIQIDLTTRVSRPIICTTSNMEALDFVEQAVFMSRTFNEFTVGLGAFDEDVLEGMIPSFLAREREKVDTIDVRNGR
jgi:hypothetical protein